MEYFTSTRLAHNRRAYCRLLPLVTAILILLGNAAWGERVVADEQAFRAAFEGLESKQNTKVSISPFPYDLTTQALKKVNRIVSSASAIYTVQLDNGVPWRHSLDGIEFDDSVMEDWVRHKNAITNNQEVYLAIAPLRDDRITWATEDDGKKAPSWVRKEKMINDRILTAYKNYVLRAIDYFKPRYLNIGVEAGDVVVKVPSRWPALERLFVETFDVVKRDHPEIKIGISWGLPLLMQSGALQRSQSIIDYMDYVGISFYPYMGQFYSKIGGVNISDPPRQWRNPLRWLKENVTKPIAICETGYSSTPVQLLEFGLDLDGSEQLQTQYVTELAQIAKRDDYLFSVFFLSIDFDELRRKLGIPVMKLWEHTGFFDEHLKPKPAWFAYRKHWLAGDNGLNPDLSSHSTAYQPSNTTKDSEIGTSYQVVANMSFLNRKHAFKTTDKISVNDQQVMKWTYKFSKDWSWAIKAFTLGLVANSELITFQFKTNKPGAFYLQLKEESGEAFFTILEPTTTWQRVTKSLDSFSIDEATRFDGILQPEKLTSIMIADNAGADHGKKGERSIELRDLYFMRK